MIEAVEAGVSIELCHIKGPFFFLWGLGGWNDIRYVATIKKIKHVWDPHHIFEGRVEVFDILRTFCLRCESVIHVEEYHTAGFSHVAEKYVVRSREKRVSWMKYLRLRRCVN